MFYLAYLCVTGPLLLRRLRGTWPTPEHGPYFSLGRWGMLVNVFAVVYGAIVAFNIAWPRDGRLQRDRPAPLVLPVGRVPVHRRRDARSAAIYYFTVYSRKPIEVLAEHSAMIEDLPVSRRIADVAPMIADGGVRLRHRRRRDRRVRASPRGCPRTRTCTVCLLEAGPSDVDDDAILRLEDWMYLLDSGYDWDYPVEPQEKGNSFLRHARAKVLGGCSSHNSCIAFWTPREDLDEWAAMGCDGLERRRVLAAHQAPGDQRRARRPPRPQRPGRTSAPSRPTTRAAWPSSRRPRRPACRRRRSTRATR